MWLVVLYGSVEHATPKCFLPHQELVSYPELNDALNCPALPQPTGIFLHTFGKVKGSFAVVRH